MNKDRFSVKDLSKNFKPRLECGHNAERGQGGNDLGRGASWVVFKKLGVSREKEGGAGQDKCFLTSRWQRLQTGTWEVEVVVCMELRDI